jgi:secreted trypsin-like serine protease
MLKFKRFGLVLSGALGVACSGAEPGVGQDTTADTSATSEDGIIRATALGGRKEVVLVTIPVYVVNPDNTVSIGTRGCSGSYFAPRVVLTAAHCLQGALAGQPRVYWGTNYAVDVAALPNDGSAPPATSKFADADSYEQHPNYSSQLNSADMAVLYLDRKLPFDPLPLARFRLDNTYVGTKVTIQGWGYGQATGPVSGTGGFILRTGKTVLLGTPTAADYHADDPNPGMLDPAVRETVVKLDGHAPNSSNCFGDSGGPIIVNKFGQDYIASVDYWGGYYCEDYSLHVRLDPFLPFLDAAYKKGGQETLIPKFVCQAPNPDGSRTAYFGYDNKNGVAITVPYGTKNSATTDTKNFRPTKFAPGKHDNGFLIDFGTTQTLTYTLAPDNSPKTTLSVTKNSTACTSAQSDLTEAGNACRSAASSGCANYSVSQCLQDRAGFNQDFNGYVPECKPQMTAYNACLASTTGSSWVCTGGQEGIAPYAPGCDDEFFDWLNCAGF